MILLLLDATMDTPVYSLDSIELLYNTELSTSYNFTALPEDVKPLFFIVLLSMYALSQLEERTKASL